MDFLRSKGLTIPEVYAYSYTPENEAGTDYMLIEYVEGTDLSEIWFNLEKNEIDLLMDQLAKLACIMLLIFRWWEHLLRHRLEAVAWERGHFTQGENHDIPLHEQVESFSLKEEKKGIPLHQQAKAIFGPQKKLLCLGPILVWKGSKWTHSEDPVRRTSLISFVTP